MIRPLVVYKSLFVVLAIIGSTSVICLVVSRPGVRLIPVENSFSKPSNIDNKVNIIPLELGIYSEVKARERVLQLLHLVTKLQNLGEGSDLPASV